MSRSARALLLVVLWSTAARSVWAQKPLCTPDEPLSSAAADLLLAGNDRPSAAQLVAAVRAENSDAVGLHALFIPASAAIDESAWLSDRRARSDADLICGSAQSEHGKLVIASARAATLAAIDAHARIVRGRLLGGFSNAELVVAGGDGRLVRVGVSGPALEKGVPLGEDVAPPFDVQLVATGSAGPRPVAERHVGDGSAPRLASAIAEAPEGTAGQAQGDLAALVVDLRRAQGRPQLRDNRLLRQAAKDHAVQVCKEGRVAHELDRGHGPPERLAAAGLSARLVGEAIARAPNASAAFEALRHSPSHLLTLLDPRFTDLGVGSATDEAGKSCFVVVLCAWPRYVGR